MAGIRQEFRHPAACAYVPVAKPRALRIERQALPPTTPARAEVVAGKIPDVAHRRFAIADVARAPRMNAFGRGMADAHHQVVTAKVERSHRLGIKRKEIPVVAASAWQTVEP